MTDMLLVYITCDSVGQAKKIGKFAIPVAHVAKKYYDWLVGEMK